MSDVSDAAVLNLNICAIILAALCGLFGDWSHRIDWCPALTSRFHLRRRVLCPLPALGVGNTATDHASVSTSAGRHYCPVRLLLSTPLRQWVS